MHIHPPNTDTLQPLVASPNRDRVFLDRPALITLLHAYARTATEQGCVDDLCLTGGAALLLAEPALRTQIPNVDFASPNLALALALGEAEDALRQQEPNPWGTWLMRHDGAHWLNNSSQQIFASLLCNTGDFFTPFTLPEDPAAPDATSTLTVMILKPELHLICKLGSLLAHQAQKTTHHPNARRDRSDAAHLLNRLGLQTREQLAECSATLAATLPAAWTAQHPASDLALAWQMVAPHAARLAAADQLPKFPVREKFSLTRVVRGLMSGSPEI